MRNKTLDEDQITEILKSKVNAIGKMLNLNVANPNITFKDTNVTFLKFDQKRLKPKVLFLDGGEMKRGFFQITVCGAIGNSEGQLLGIASSISTELKKSYEVVDGSRIMLDSAIEIGQGYNDDNFYCIPVRVDYTHY